MSAEQKIKIAGWVFWTALTVSIALLVAGFLVPPPGIIHPSVLTAVGELFAFAALGVGFEAVRLGRNLRISKGDLMAEITRKKGENHAITTDNYGETQSYPSGDMGLGEEGAGR